jgi:hypothetical protein
VEFPAAGGGTVAGMVPMTLDTNGNSVPDVPTNVPSDDCSGVITTGGQSQLMIAQKSTLHGFMLQSIDPTAPSN